MKKFFALALVTLGITVPARAQWIVYVPANTVQSVINTAQEIARVAHPPPVLLDAHRVQPMRKSISWIGGTHFEQLMCSARARNTARALLCSPASSPRSRPQIVKARRGFDIIPGERQNQAEFRTTKTGTSA